MLYDRLKKYSKSGIYPFHMPGHKRNSAISDGTLPFDIDITEIYDFDNLHEPNGCIKAVEDKAASIYGVKRAFMLVNGATGGILSAICALTDFGDTVIVARNCHKSVYNAIELCGLNAIYALPNIDREFGVFSSVSPENIETLLKSNRNAKLVILTSPTYEGVVSDIQTISEICHKYGAKLFVDEAHGAHFPFSDKFPNEAVSCGADAAVVSLHKTLPSLTQTALLLTDNASFSVSLQRSLSVFETSSPSYVLMSSIENCLDFMCGNPGLTEDYTERLYSFSEKCKKLNTLKVMCCGNDSVKKHNFFDFDISKIVISTSRAKLTGSHLADILRSKYKIELEMAYTNYALAITSVCDAMGAFDSLFEALAEIDAVCVKSQEKNIGDNYTVTLPIKAFKSSEMKGRNGKFVLLDDAAEAVSLEYIWAYPPGIPLVVPGEFISLEMINQIKYIEKSGVKIHSDFGRMPKIIYVAELD